MKKMLALLAATALMGGIMAGCSKPEEGDTSATGTTAGSGGTTTPPLKSPPTTRAAPRLPTAARLPERPPLQATSQPTTRVQPPAARLPAAKLPRLAAKARSASRFDGHRRRQ